MIALQIIGYLIVAILFGSLLVTLMEADLGDDGEVDVFDRFFAGVTGILWPCSFPLLLVIVAIKYTQPLIKKAIYSMRSKET